MLLNGYKDLKRSHACNISVKLYTSNSLTNSFLLSYCWCHIIWRIFSYKKYNPLQQLQEGRDLFARLKHILNVWAEEIKCRKFWKQSTECASKDTFLSYLGKSRIRMLWEGAGGTRSLLLSFLTFAGLRKSPADSWNHLFLSPYFNLVTVRILYRLFNIVLWNLNMLIHVQLKQIFFA